MRNYLFHIIVCMASLNVGAQNNYAEVADKFIKFYNKQIPDSIFALYSSFLKEKLPLEKTRAVFSGLHIEFGELKSLELLKQDSGFNMYRASFAHQTLTLLLALTDDNFIEGFRLVPYNQEQFPEQKNIQK